MLRLLFVASILLLSTSSSVTARTHRHHNEIDTVSSPLMKELNQIQHEIRQIQRNLEQQQHQDEQQDESFESEQEEAVEEDDEDIAGADEADVPVTKKPVHKVPAKKLSVRGHARALPRSTGSASIPPECTVSVQACVPWMASPSTSPTCQANAAASASLSSNCFTCVKAWRSGDLGAKGKVCPETLPKASDITDECKVSVNNCSAWSASTSTLPKCQVNSVASSNLSQNCYTCLLAWRESTGAKEKVCPEH